MGTRVILLKHVPDSITSVFETFYCLPSSSRMKAKDPTWTLRLLICVPVASLTLAPISPTLNHLASVSLASSALLK